MSTNHHLLQIAYFSSIRRAFLSNSQKVIFTDINLLALFRGPLVFDVPQNISHTPPHTVLNPSRGYKGRSVRGLQLSAHGERAHGELGTRLDSQTLGRRFNSSPVTISTVDGISRQLYKHNYYRRWRSRGQHCPRRPL